MCTTYLLDDLGYLYKTHDFDIVTRVNDVNMTFKKILIEKNYLYLLDFDGIIHNCSSNNISTSINSVALDDYPPGIINFYKFYFTGVKKHLFILYDFNATYYIYVDNIMIQIFHNITSFFTLYNDSDNVRFLFMTTSDEFIVTVCSDVDNSYKLIKIPLNSITNKWCFLMLVAIKI
jgi:hypothetical protein